MSVSRRTVCQGLGATALAGVSWDRQPPLILGDDVFVGTVRQSLALLSTRWGWLSDTLDVIQPAADELPEGAAAGLLVRDGYLAVLRTTDAGVAYTASLIAHEAWHAHQHSQGRRYYGRDAEREAWALQACVLADLAPGHAAVPWLLASIAGLPDGGPLAGNPKG